MVIKACGRGRANREIAERGERERRIKLGDLLKEGKEKGERVRLRGIEENAAQVRPLNGGAFYSPMTLMRTFLGRLPSNSP
jgi:hypothetical protein